MLTRAEAEDFLYHEAALLDEWRLQEWLALLTEDAQYWVPATDRPQGNPENTLFLIADDMVRLRARIARLESPHAHAESPRSRTRRLISNVRVLKDDGSEMLLWSNFAVYRFRGEISDYYVGHYEHTLRRDGSGLKISLRKAILDLEALRPTGKVSIIL
ncbi:MAG: aromatic-ring-hydroxylating dioxygenase subunit beta [Candidatus Binataceae bacterium]|nr:aromatic-ring-hydroxylating dioxygenase subunit beta [Candidatus Binataceae bacterium]